MLTYFISLQKGREGYLQLPRNATNHNHISFKAPPAWQWRACLAGVSPWVPSPILKKTRQKLSSAYQMTNLLTSLMSPELMHIHSASRAASLKLILETSKNTKEVKVPLSS